MPELELKRAITSTTNGAAPSHCLVSGAVLGTYAETDRQAKKAEIKAEMVKLEKAAALFGATLTTFGALKAVEYMLPAIVRAQLCTLETAILEYSKASEECAEEVAP